MVAIEQLSSQLTWHLDPPLRPPCHQSGKTLYRGFQTTTSPMVETTVGTMATTLFPHWSTSLSLPPLSLLSALRPPSSNPQKSSLTPPTRSRDLFPLSASQLIYSHHLASIPHLVCAFSTGIAAPFLLTRRHFRLTVHHFGFSRCIQTILDSNP